jgi:cell division protein FtsL
MGDLGEIFDQFSQVDEKKSRKAQDSESQGTTSETDTKSLLIKKLTQNKGLLITLIIAGILVIGIIIYFLAVFINSHGVKGINDTIAPFIK